MSSTYQYDWTYNFGVYYWSTTADNWVEGWHATIRPIDGTSTDKFSKDRLLVTFYKQGGAQSGNSTIISGAWHYSNSTKEIGYVSLWLDLWFANVNTSTYGGLRISEQYCSVANINDIWHFWYQTWAPYQTDETVALYTAPILDSNKAVIDLSDIKMVKPFVNFAVNSTGVCPITVATNGLSFNVAKNSVQWQGVDTPELIPYLVPTMPNGSFLSDWLALVGKAVSGIVQAIDYGAIGSWKVLLASSTQFSAIWAFHISSRVSLLSHLASGTL